jgi:hypothetical protein
MSVVAQTGIAPRGEPQGEADPPEHGQVQHRPSVARSALLRGCAASVATSDGADRGWPANRSSLTNARERRLVDLTGIEPVTS